MQKQKFNKGSQIWGEGEEYDWKKWLTNIIASSIWLTAYWNYCKTFGFLTLNPNCNAKNTSALSQKDLIFSWIN